MRAVRADGTPAALKVNFPEPETEHEAEALAHWGGRGAVRLLERDDERRALLVERCDPGTQLSPGLPRRERLRAGREPWLAIDPKPVVGEAAFDTASLLRDRRESIVRDPWRRARMRRRLDLLSDELGLDRERMRGWGVAHALAWGVADDGVHAAHVECAAATECLMRAEATRDLDAPRADVWGFLAEPYHLSDWWPGISSVRPDRRGFAPGARWEVVGPDRPTLFRKAYAPTMLLVRDVESYVRASWYLTAERLTVEVVLEAIDPDHTRVRLSVEGPWRPEAFGRPRALPKQALARLHALCQTAASL